MHTSLVELLHFALFRSQNVHLATTFLANIVV